MSLFGDILKGNEEIFDGWQINFFDYMPSRAESWEIPQLEVSNLNILKTNWDNSYAIGGKQHKTTRTSEQVTAKNHDRKVYVLAIRSFIKRFIAFNPLVTNAQRIAMQTTVHDRVYTPQPVPKTTPLVDVSLGRGNHIIFHFSQQPDAAGVSKRGKPKKVHGIKVYYKKGLPAPATIDDCNKNKIFTRMKGILNVFTPADAGVAVNGFVCFVNNKEQEGPFSEMFSTIVPK